MIWFAVLAVAVTASMACVDYASARYVQAVQARRRGAASFWTVAQWAATSVGFVAAVKFTFWLLPFEPLGLFLGSWLGTGTREPGSEVVTS